MATAPRRALGALLALTLLGFVQTGTTQRLDPRLHSIAAVFSPAHCNPYDPLPTQQAAARLVRGEALYTRVETRGASYIYPPLMAVVHRPLAHLDRPRLATALFVLHRLLLLGIVGALVALLRPVTPDRTAYARTLLGALGLCLLWYPLTRALELHQASVWVTALVGAAIVTAHRGGTTLAGALLAVAAAIKPPIALSLPLLYWHSRRAVAGAGATLGALGALSLACVGIAPHRDYLTRVLPALGPGYGFYPNQSWNGLLNRLQHDNISFLFALAPADATVQVGSTLLGLCTLAFFAVRLRRLRSASLAEVIALAWFAATLASPISWEHHYAPGVFAVALLWRRLRDESHVVSVRLLVGAALVGSYFELRGLESPIAGLLLSYVFFGGWLLAWGWLDQLEGAPSLRSSRWMERLRRWQLPLAPSLSLGLERTLLCACIALGVLLCLQLLSFGYGRDQGIFAVVARTLLAGGMPYRDAWDFKPPAIFLTYALARAVWGSSMFAIRALELAGVLSACAAAVVLSRRFVGAWGPGVVSSLLLIMGWVHLGFWHTAQPESFAAVALLWALVLATGSPPPPASTGWRPHGPWVMAGVLYGVAACFKPQLGGGLALTPWVLGWQATRAAPTPATSWRSWARASGPSLLSMLLGAALPLGAMLAWLGLRGALPDARAVFLDFVPHYSALGHRRAGVGALLFQALHESFVRFSRHNAYGLLLLAALPPLSPRERRGVGLVVATWLPTVLGVGLQAKFFEYHYGAALPLMALLGGWGLWKAWLRVRHALVPTAAFVVLCIGLVDHRSGQWDQLPRYLAASPLWGHPESGLDPLHVTSDFDARDNRAIAAWIDQTVPPGAPVYLWGFEPVVYDLANRPTATRYIYNVPQRVPWAAPLRAQLLDDLRLHPPAAVVVMHGDRLPHVTGTHSDSADDLGGFPALQSLLAHAYRPASRLGRFQGLQRTRGAAPTPGALHTAAPTPCCRSSIQVELNFLVRALHLASTSRAL